MRSVTVKEIVRGLPFEELTGLKRIFKQEEESEEHVMEIEGKGDDGKGEEQEGEVEQGEVEAY